MSAMDECKECGSIPYHSANFARLRDEVHFWQNKAKAAHKELAVVKLDQDLMAFKDRTDVVWLQAKVVAQRRELKRLNDARNVMGMQNYNSYPKPDIETNSITVLEVGAKHRDA